VRGGSRNPTLGDIPTLYQELLRSFIEGRWKAFDREMSDSSQDVPGFELTLVPDVFGRAVRIGGDVLRRLDELSPEALAALIAWNGANERRLTRRVLFQRVTITIGTLSALVSAGRLVSVSRLPEDGWWTTPAIVAVLLIALAVMLGVWIRLVLRGSRIMNLMHVREFGDMLAVALAFRTAANENMKETPKVRPSRSSGAAGTASGTG
jgi:hypothetical protein